MLITLNAKILFLMSITYYVIFIYLFLGINNLEGGSLALTGQQYERNMLTRDYFDFHVSHLSCSTNGIANESSDAFLANTLSTKLSQTTAILQDENWHPLQLADVRLSEKTVGIITFSMASGSSKYKNNKSQENVRIEYFLSTFWSGK